MCLPKFAASECAPYRPLGLGLDRAVGHRLARGGNRQLNRVLFTIARSQARWHPDARAYWRANEPKERAQPKPDDA